MAVHYEVKVGETFMVSGPANVTVKGGETPLVVDSAEDFQAHAPTITSLEPATAESGSEDFTLYVTGENFTGDTILVFGDQDEPTTLNEDGTVSTIVKPSIFAPAAVPVAVRNGPARSAPVDFIFTDPDAPETTSKGRKKRRDD
jgi:hypothetical protein